jgi:hypothetical protein
VRSKKSIKRFALLIRFAYSLILYIENSNFSKGFSEFKSLKNNDVVEFIYNQSKLNVPLERVKNLLKVA